MRTIAKHHELVESDDKPVGSSDRAFGLVFASLFTIFALLPLRSASPVRAWALVLGAVFLGASLFRPSLLAPLNRIWTRFGMLLHRVMSPVVLGIVFFAIFLPVGVLRRYFGGDPMTRVFEPLRKSYWIRREPPGPPPVSMTQAF